MADDPVINEPMTKAEAFSKWLNPMPELTDPRYYAGRDPNQRAGGSRGEMEEPVLVEIPAFLLEPEEPEAVEEPVPEPETVPADLLDLVREDEPYGDTQTRLWELYLELNGKLMLGLATEEDARLHTRLHGHLAWISKGAAEVV
jgi:hypothetical protein